MSSVRVRKVLWLYKDLLRARERLVYTDKNYYTERLRAQFREKPKDFDDFKARFEAGIKFKQDLGGLM